MSFASHCIGGIVAALVIETVQGQGVYSGGSSSSFSGGGFSSGGFSSSRSSDYSSRRRGDSRSSSSSSATQSNGGGATWEETRSSLILIGIMAAAVIAGLLLREIYHCSEDWRHTPPSVQEFLSKEEAVEAAGSLALPSGQWRGYYHQLGSQHQLAHFRFHFAPNGDLGGAGVDNIGQYIIRGRFSRSAVRIAFSKFYQRGSRAADGVVNDESNLGHSVEYRGVRVGPSLGQGIKGKWFICHKESGYRGMGDFHLWPAEGWQDQVSSTLSTTFKVAEDNLCVACFSEPIDVCLLPCLHVAVCSSCTLRLDPYRCPICRQNIDKLEFAATDEDARVEQEEQEATEEELVLSKLAFSDPLPSGWSQWY